MLFYTFCVDIKKHSRETLSNALNLLLNSIHKYIKNYKLLCFTNFKIKNIPKKYNIEYRTYYDNQKEKLYPFSDWLNLSFNKINIYKDLHDEFNKDFIWIDLDTVIYYDISYINDLANVFIENGGTSVDPITLFSNNNYITVPTNIYIQGNFWKLNIDLYNKLMITLDKIKIKNLRLQYDLQDLFNYYTYIENNGKLNNINIIGNNVKTESINGLCVWSKIGNTHAGVDGLNNVYINNNRLRTNFYPDKEIHILSFTFDTLKKLYNLNKFNKLFNQLNYPLLITAADVDAVEGPLYRYVPAMRHRYVATMRHRYVAAMRHRYVAAMRHRYVATMRRHKHQRRYMLWGAKRRSGK